MSEDRGDMARRGAALLREMWAGMTSKKSRRACEASIWHRLVENRVPVVVSLALATVIYYGIHDRPTEEFVRNVAVKVRGASEGSSIGINPPTVRVVFKGLREDMLALDMAQPIILVNNPGDKALVGGTNSVPLKKRDVRLPALRGFGSVSVVRFDPDKVTLVKDEIASMDFDIEPPKLEGTPSPGYRAEIIDYSPKRAAVTGGGSRLKGWDALGHKLQTAPVSVDGLGLGEVVRFVEILPPTGEDAMDVSLPLEKVEVKVRVLEQRTPMPLEGEIPVRLSFPQGFPFPKGVVVEPTSVRATLVGAEEQLRDVSPANVAVYAEVPEGAVLTATNALEVALVARVPQDKSILEITLAPPKVALTAVEPLEGPEKPEGQEPPESPAVEPRGDPAAREEEAAP